MQYLMAVVVGGGIGFLAFCLLARPLDWMLFHVMGRRMVMPEAERRFRAVFSIMSEDARISLLNYYINRNVCSRLEAMVVAVEERQRETVRW